MEFLTTRTIPLAGIGEDESGNSLLESLCKWKLKSDEGSKIPEIWVQA